MCNVARSRPQGRRSGGEPPVARTVVRETLLVWDPASNHSCRFSTVLHRPLLPTLFLRTFPPRPCRSPLPPSRCVVLGEERALQPPPPPPPRVHAPSLRPRCSRRPLPSPTRAPCGHTPGPPSPRALQAMDDEDWHMATDLALAVVCALSALAVGGSEDGSPSPFLLPCRSPPSPAWAARAPCEPTPLASSCCIACTWAWGGVAGPRVGRAARARAPLSAGGHDRTGRRSPALSLTRPSVSRRAPPAASAPTRVCSSAGVPRPNARLSSSPSSSQPPPPPPPLPPSRR